MKKVVVPLILALLPLNVTAATKSQTMRVCVARSGSFVAKARCGKGETALTATNLANFGVVGQQGTQGIPGPAGTIDPNRCVTRTESAEADGYVVARTNCGEGEFLMTHGVQTGSVYSEIISISLLYLPNKSYPTGVEYETGLTGGARDPNEHYKIFVDAVCCR